MQVYIYCSIDLPKSLPWINIHPLLKWLQKDTFLTVKDIKDAENKYIISINSCISLEVIFNNDTIVGISDINSCDHPELKTPTLEILKSALNYISSSKIKEFTIIMLTTDDVKSHQISFFSIKNKSEKRYFWISHSPQVILQYNCYTFTTQHKSWLSN